MRITNTSHTHHTTLHHITTSRHITSLFITSHYVTLHHIATLQVYKKVIAAADAPPPSKSQKNNAKPPPAATETPSSGTSRFGKTFNIRCFILFFVAKVVYSITYVPFFFNLYPVKKFPLPPLSCDIAFYLLSAPVHSFSSYFNFFLSRSPSLRPPSSISSNTFPLSFRPSLPSSHSFPYPSSLLLLPSLLFPSPDDDAPPVRAPVRKPSASALGATAKKSTASTGGETLDPRFHITLLINITPLQLRLVSDPLFHFV